MSLPVEFQAVIFAAGKGSRMVEITSGIPKCLIPVGPKPLIFYPLYKLQSWGFTECFIIVLENQKFEIQTVIDKLNLSIKVEYQLIPNDEELGTADSLRLMSDKFHSDVLIIPCDIITNVDLQNVANVFRKHKASVASLFLQPQTYDFKTVPGPKIEHKPERDIVGIDAISNRLVFLASASDFEDEVSLPRSLLRKHTCIDFHSTLVDSHIYLLRNWVVKYLNTLEHISSLKGEFIPHIVRKQLAVKPKKQETSPSLVNAKENDDIFTLAKEDDLDLLIREMSSYNDHVGDSKGAYHDDSIRCYAVVSKKSEIGIRVNTLPSYSMINTKIIDEWNKIIPDKDLVLQSPKAEILSTQIDNKCIIWEGVKLNQKTSFKNSVIGANVEVNSFSRVFNSIIMKNVVIKERVAIENCIISNGVVIETGSNLKNCLVGSHHNVPAESEHTNEVLTEADDHLLEF